MIEKHNIDFKTWSTMLLFSSLIANYTSLAEAFSSNDFDLLELLKIVFYFSMATFFYVVVLGIGYFISVAFFWISSDWVNLARYAFNNKFDHEKRREENSKIKDWLVKLELAFPVFVLCSLHVSMALILCEKSFFDLLKSISTWI